MEAYLCEEQPAMVLTMATILLDRENESSKAKLLEKSKGVWDLGITLREKIGEKGKPSQEGEKEEEVGEDFDLEMDHVSSDG